MGRDIVTNLITNDKSSKNLDAASDAAKKTARNYDDLSAAEQRLALAAEKAGAAVEKAAKAAANAEQRFGKESEQARAATLRLRSAKLDLADAEQKVAASARAAGDAADDATKQVHQLADAADRADVSVGRSGGALGRFGGVLGRVVPTFGPAVAGFASFGTVALTAAPPVISLGLHVAALGVKVARFAGTVAPAAASLLPLAAGLAAVKGTILLAGPAIMKSLGPITAAFMGTSKTVGGKKTMVGGLQEEIGKLASRGLPALAREFVKVNFPAIRSGMDYIAQSINGIVVAVGKWINSTTGQRAIAASINNISEAFADLAPDISKLAISFLNLFGRTAGDTRAVDLLATGLNRAIGFAIRFMDSLTPAKIDAAWSAIGRFAGGVQDFVSKIPGWAGQVMGAVRWWRAHAEQIQHVRDVLGVVAVVVGVATGGWIPALIAGVSLLVAHWDDVTGALQRVQHWFSGTSDEASTTRGVIAALQGAVGDLWSWFKGKLLPALERAGQAILPALRDAVHSVSDNLAKNKDIVGKVQGVLTALGIVLTEAVIPALTWMFQQGLPLVTDQFNTMLTIVNKVVLPGIRVFTHLVLDQIGAVIHGAAALADAFGLPLAGKLKEAARKFDRFRDQVNGALSGITDQKVSVTATIGYTTGKGTASAGLKVGYRARGGPITGPGGPRDDRVPAMLSNGEYVVNAAATARHRGLLEAINSGRGYARGGIVMSTSTSGIPQMMAAERKALAAAAKRMAPDLSVGAVGGGVARWAPLVLQVLSMLGQSSAALGPVLSRMRRESGGNPRAINLTDINAQRGDPSIGLMQTIGATFRAYAGPFRGRGIYDPLANIYAGINYATHRYGRGWVGRMTMPGGYDRGGLARGAGLMAKYTAAPERVLSPAQTVRFERAMASAAQPAEIHYHFDRYVGNRDELIRELKAAHDRGALRQIGLAS